MNIKQELKFFDGNCAIGRKPKKEVWEVCLENAQDLGKEMEYLNISEVLVYHLSARDHDPEAGNNLLLKEIHGYPKMHGSMAINPDILWKDVDLP